MKVIKLENSFTSLGITRSNVVNMMMEVAPSTLLSRVVAPSTLLSRVVPLRRIATLTGNVIRRSIGKRLLRLRKASLQDCTVLTMRC